jgi:hypothetical protein
VGLGRVTRRRGEIRVRLHAEEREVLDAVLDQLREALLAGTDDPVLERLFPPAYADDPEKEAGYQVLARQELVDSQLAAIEGVRASLHRDRLDDDAAATWMRSLNALRLVLGTRLDVSEEVEPVIEADDPDAPVWTLYFFLSALVDDLVDVLSEP